MVQESTWKHLETISQLALQLAPTSYLDKIRAGCISADIPGAVADHDTPWLFDQLIGVAQMQGISDASAAAFTAKHGIVSWGDVATAIDAAPACPRLRSYWDFSDCRYRKGAGICSEPRHLGQCPLPTHPARKGSLIVAAYSLSLFLRDVCDGDLVAWLDVRLAEADRGLGAPDRAVAMSRALVAPLSEISGIGPKVWSMALADLLLVADPNRERWVTAGASMIVVDSLLHNHLHRTGTLRRFGAEHPYGPRCYGPGGCASIIRGLAERIDAREFNPAFPASFPRFIQFAIWRLCSASELDLCNGNRIDDRRRCMNHGCPAFSDCDRVVLHRKPSGLPMPPGA